MKTFSLTQGKLAYVSKGKKNPTFLLVHNSGGNHEMMNELASHLSKRGKVLIPDLLGHGASDSPKIEYTVKFFAESLIKLCSHENCNQIIYIGLHYGACIGIEIAKIAPLLISHLILLDPTIFMEPWVVNVVEQVIEKLKNPPEGWEEETISSAILKASNDNREIALRALKLTPIFVRASTFTNLLAWDKNHNFICPIPTLIIQGSQPFCKEEKVRKVFSNLQVGRVVGSGLWPTIEVPAQIHSMIDRFLEIY